MTATYFHGTGPVISGVIKNTAGAGLAGVKMSASGAVCTTTDSSGAYTCSLDYGWSGTITPVPCWGALYTFNLHNHPVNLLGTAQ